MPVKAVIWALVCGMAVCLLAIIWTMPAHAQQQTMCGPIAEVLKVWKDRFKEEVVWGGTVPNEGKPFEMVLTQSPAGTWTIIVIRGSIGCPVGNGNGGSPLITGRGA